MNSRKIVNKFPRTHNFFDRNEGMIGNIRILHNLTSIIEHKTITAVIGPPNMGKTWILEELARIYDDKVSDALVGFHKAVSSDTSHIESVVHNLYNNWLERSSIQEQLQMLQLIRNKGGVLNKIATIVTKVPGAEIFALPMSELLKIQDQLKDGNVIFKENQGEKLKQLVGYILEVSQKPIYLFFDSWGETKSSMEMEVQLFKHFLKNETNNSKLRLILGVQNRDISLNSKQNSSPAINAICNDILPSAYAKVKLYDLPPLQFEHPKVKDKLFTIIAPNKDYKRKLSSWLDTRLISRIGGYPGAFSNIKELCDRSLLLNKDDLLDIIYQSKNIQYQGLVSELQKLSGDELDFAISIALVEEIDNESWYLLHDLIPDELRHRTDELTLKFREIGIFQENFSMKNFNSYLDYDADRELGIIYENIYKIVFENTPPDSFITGILEGEKGCKLLTDYIRSNFDKRVNSDYYLYKERSLKDYPEGTIEEIIEDCKKYLVYAPLDQRVLSINGTYFLSEEFRSEIPKCHLVGLKHLDLNVFKGKYLSMRKRQRLDLIESCLRSAQEQHITKDDIRYGNKSKFLNFLFKLAKDIRDKQEDTLIPSLGDYSRRTFVLNWFERNRQANTKKMFSKFFAQLAYKRHFSEYHNTICKLQASAFSIDFSDRYVPISFINPNLDLIYARIVNSGSGLLHKLHSDESKLLELLWKSFGDGFDEINDISLTLKDNKYFAPMIAAKLIELCTFNVNRNDLEKSKNLYKKVLTINEKYISTDTKVLAYNLPFASSTDSIFSDFHHYIDTFEAIDSSPKHPIVNMEKENNEVNTIAVKLSRQG